MKKTRSVSLLSYEEAARYLGVCRRTICEWVSLRRISVCRLPGRTRRIRLVDLQELIARGYRPAVVSAPEAVLAESAKGLRE